VGKADLHLHTTFSDGAITVPALLDVAAQRELSGLALTDHDTIAGAEKARQFAWRDGYPVEIIVGEEVTTRDGHIVGLFLREAIPPGLSAAATVAAIHAQGGLAFAPHPFFNDHPRRQRRKMDSIGHLAATLPLDAIEVDNSTPCLEWANLQARRFALRHGLPMLGASDAHIPAAVGKSHTLFPGHGARALHRAIRAGTVLPGTCRYGPLDLFRYLCFWLGYGRPTRHHHGRGRQEAATSAALPRGTRAT
jgi:predicted metal-dependent phosphoesterase TrpH